MPDNNIKNNNITNNKNINNNINSFRISKYKSFQQPEKLL